MEQKVCTKCKALKDLDSFDLHTKGRYGRHPRCKVCRGEYESQRFKQLSAEHKRRLKKRQRETERFRLRGISREVFLAMVLKQKGKCLICRKWFGEKLCIDHDHATGKVRGLLCKHCNLGIGLLEENLPNLRAAIRYLRKFGGLAESGIASAC